MENVTVGATRYIYHQIDGKDLLVVEGHSPTDLDFAYHAKSDSRTGRNFYVNMAGKGSVWKLPDVIGASASSEEKASRPNRSESLKQSNEENAVQAPEHPAKVTVGTTTYILFRVEDGTEAVCVRGVDPKVNPNFVWAVRFDKRTNRFYYTNVGRGERKWTLPEVTEGERNPELPNYKARVTAMFQEYAPDKVGNVDAAMNAYLGQEEALIEALVAKYGPEPGATQKDPGVSSQATQQVISSAVAAEVPQQKVIEESPLEPVTKPAPVENKKAEGSSDALRLQYEDSVHRNVELQTRISILEGNLMAAEEREKKQVRQHEMEVNGLKMHIEELNKYTEQLKTVESPQVQQLKELCLQNERALLQGIREHTQEMLKKEEERTAFYAEKSSWQAERFAAKVELMSLQQNLQSIQEKSAAEACKYLTFDSDIAVYKARIAAIQNDRDALQAESKSLVLQLEEAKRQGELIQVQAGLRTGTTLTIECSSQTNETSLPRKLPLSEIENERALVASGSWQQETPPQEGILLTPQTKVNSVERASPSKPVLVSPKPLRGQQVDADLYEIRGAALARQREHIASLETTVARLQMDLQLAKGKASIDSPSTLSRGTESSGAAEQQLKEARAQLKRQKREICDLRGLLTKHLSVSQSNPSIEKHSTPGKTSHRGGFARDNHHGLLQSGSTTPSSSPSPVLGRVPTL